MYITKDQLKQIIGNAPAGSRPEVLLREIVARGNIVEGFNEPKKGILRSIAEGVVRPAARVGVQALNFGESLVDLAKGDVAGANAATNKTRNVPLLGQVAPYVKGSDSFGQAAKKTIGAGLEVGSTYIGGAGGGGILKQGLKGAVLQGAKEGVKTGFSAGVLQGTGSGLVENKSVGQSLKQGVVSGLGGAAIGGAVGVTLPVLRNTLNKVPVVLEAASKPKQTLGKNLTSFGEKIQTSVIKPQITDIKNGFKIENVTKHDLGGNLGDALVKTQSKLKSYNSQLKKIIKKFGDTPTINLSESLEQLKNSTSGAGLKNLGSTNATKKAIAEIESELDSIVPDWRTRQLTFQEAIDAKRASGLYASFIHDPLRNGAGAEEKVWNNLYRILQKETEKKAPKQFQEVNRALSEIIPVEQALIRRIPVAERNNVLSLPDTISFTIGSAIDPRAFGVTLFNRLLRSGKFANFLSQAGKKMTK